MVIVSRKGFHGGFSRSLSCREKRVLRDQAAQDNTYLELETHELLDIKYSLPHPGSSNSSTHS